MIEIELDGKKVSVPEGSMVIHAAEAAGTYVPHFCYHKKLSIAANCRMCLVDVEKAPKPMPACATPVTNGMIVRTNSPRAVAAQKSVMEFLLINHPLDCPICDQGGECQLQDLAVGYGGSASRYQEEKRVVFHKNVGPLISMEEMARCIHCTRCVRFGQELGGVMELGMLNRGEHSEITTFLGRTIDSEVSGNMIDLCPVGALTSKPFRYSARTWELARRHSISPHDSTGANLIVQVKGQRVMRVLPQDNEAVNECWIADRDRFSYEALNSPQRLTQPWIKQGGQWIATDWTTALEYVATGLKDIVGEHGAKSVGAWVSPHRSSEELYLTGAVLRALGSDHIDHRLRQTDFSERSGAIRWLGMPIATLSSLQRVLVVGSFLRKDHPLMAMRLRAAARAGGQIYSLNALKQDWLMPMAGQSVAAPSQWLDQLKTLAAEIAVAEALEVPFGAKAPEAGAPRSAMAQGLLSGERRAVLLGNGAMQHPQAGQLLEVAHWIAKATGSALGVLGEAANSVGAQWVGAQPQADGHTITGMLVQPPKALLLLDVEPVLDVADPAAAHRALQQAEMVVALTSFKDAAVDGADVLLPIAPFTETAGSFVNAEGRLQSFNGVVQPLGDTRPAWKVLRVLANLLGLPGFQHDSIEDVRRELIEKRGPLSAALEAGAREPQAAGQAAAPAATAGAFERLAEVPIYATDPLVRRAPALQATRDGQPPVAHLGSAAWARLGLQAGDRVRVTQAGGSAVLPAVLDASLADGVIRVPAGHPDTCTLGAMAGRVDCERVPAAAGVRAEGVPA